MAGNAHCKTSTPGLNSEKLVNLRAAYWDRECFVFFSSRDPIIQVSIPVLLYSLIDSSIGLDYFAHRHRVRSETRPRLMPQEMSTAWGVMRSNDIQTVIMSTFTTGATSVMSRKSLQRHKPELSGGGGEAAKSPGSNYHAAIDLAAAAHLFSNRFYSLRLRP